MTRLGYDKITPRQREVWALMAEGLDNRGIGQRLFLGERAVERNVSEILWKLGLWHGQNPGVHRRVTAVLRFHELRAAGRV